MKTVLIATASTIVLLGVLAAPYLANPTLEARCRDQGGTVVEVPGRTSLCIRR